MSFNFKDYKLTYKFQKKDERDYTINIVDNKIILNTSKSATIKNITILKPTFMISFVGIILDQKELGSCVCNSAALMISTMTKNKIHPSRLLLYALSRIYDNTSLDQDSGTTVRTTCKMIQKYGICVERLYSYNINNFTNIPPLNVFKESTILKNFTYYSVNQDLQSLKHCLVSYNQPITFGILVYNSFMTDSVAQTGIVPMPDVNNEELLGGHCITMVGYDDTKSWFICANSWGTNWGKKGLFYLPYDYVLDTNLSSDFFRYTFVL
jgi:C1A family cysteine protease